MQFILPPVPQNKRGLLQWRDKGTINKTKYQKKNQFSFGMMLIVAE
jgi:hypothetical protein